MHEVEVKRRMAEEDIAEIAALARAAEAADGHAALGEHQWLDLVQGGRAGSAGFVARADGHRAVLGYAQLSRGPTSWAVELVVRPGHRGTGITSELLRAALDEVAVQGGGHVHLWVAKPTPSHDEAAAAVGLRRGRELLQLRRPLPLEAALDARADGVAVRAFRVGEDEPAWLEVNNRAFGNHPEQGSWDLATLQERERQPWFDPAGLLLHEQGGRLLGFCWTKRQEEEPEVGEIYVLGVDPEAQHAGLGRALLAAGCRHLAEAGTPVAMLYVDAESPALALYRSFGFAVDHHDRAYVGDVPAR